MDLLIMLLFAVVLTVICVPYLSNGEQAEGLSETVLTTSTFKVDDLPYCDVALCQRVKCFTYYQEVLGVWRSWHS